MSREQLERAGGLPPRRPASPSGAARSRACPPPGSGGTPRVGRRNGRGVVVSATYEARAAGVHSAMPMGTAMRACPAATVIEPSREKYSAASRDVMAILNDVTAYVDEVSIDEAFLDVSGARRTLGSPTQVATETSRNASSIDTSNEVALTAAVFSRGRDRDDGGKDRLDDGKT